MLADRIIENQERERQAKLADLASRTLGSVKKTGIPTKNDKVNLDGLDPRIKRNLENFIKDNPFGGRVTSGYRSYQEQEQLYNSNNPYPVARPGTSRHEKGIAFDASGSTQAMDWFAKNAKRYGFNQPVANDPVHFEMNDDLKKQPLFNPRSAESIYGNAVNSMPAGLRNNNPGNLKDLGIEWEGRVGPSKNLDEGTPQVVFDSPEAGARAMMMNLRTQIEKKGLNTLESLIAAYSPSAAQHAIPNIAKNAGLDPTAKLDYNDAQQMMKLARGIVTQEHGQAAKVAISDELLKTGYYSSFHNRDGGGNNGKASSANSAGNARGAVIAGNYKPGAIGKASAGFRAGGGSSDQANTHYEEANIDPFSNGADLFANSTAVEHEQFLQKQYQQMLNSAMKSLDFTKPFQG